MSALETSSGPGRPGGDDDVPDTPSRGFFGQPRALAHLFGVEMWERFSFYGMQGILLIYLSYKTADGGLGISTATATSIVGAYGGTVYLATIVGAWLADRVTGPERTLFLSAVLVMIGHIALSVLPGLLGVGVGLVCVALGSGGVKANATTIVGTLYTPDDVRRDAGFSLFYLGINLGALIGPLLTGVLQSEVGFHYGFGLAAVGMAAGLVQYTWHRRQLPEQASRVPDPLSHRARWTWAGIGLAVAALIAVLAVVGALPAGQLATIVAVVAAVAAAAYFVLITTSSHVDRLERRRVLSYIPMFIASVAFWSLYQQQFSVVTIYAVDSLNRDLFGWDMPVSWVQSINPVFVILLSGVFAGIWTKLGDRQPTSPVKFACGTVVMGAAFLLFIPWATAAKNTTPLLALTLILLVFTVAELLLSPVNLSLSTKLAPRAFRSQMVALQFLSVAIGTALAGALAENYHSDDQTPYFLVLGLVAVAVGVALALVSPLVSRLMSGVR